MRQVDLVFFFFINNLKVSGAFTTFFLRISQSRVVIDRNFVTQYWSNSKRFVVIVFCSTRHDRHKKKYILLDYFCKAVLAIHEHIH